MPSRRHCAYPNTQFEPFAARLARPPYVLRLKKRSEFITRLRVPDPREPEPPLMDHLLAAMQATGGPCAVHAAQHALADYHWPDGARVSVRMGLHPGEPYVADNDYTGVAVHRAARICTVAHGGQVLLSRSTAGIVDDHEAAAQRSLRGGRRTRGGGLLRHGYGGVPDGETGRAGSRRRPASRRGPRVAEVAETGHQRCAPLRAGRDRLGWPGGVALLCALRRRRRRPDLHIAGDGESA
jgi:hypothetical protein